MTKVSFSGIQSSFTVHDDGVNRCMYNSIAGQGSNLSIAFINEHAAYVKYLYYTSSEAFNFNSWSVPVTLETDVQLSQNHVQYSGATPWIAFMSGPAGVMVGSFESGTWDLSTIEPRIINSPENQIDLKFTSDFLPRVSFWGFTANCVSYDAWNGSGWDKASVVTDFPGGGDGKFPALDVDSGGHSHLAFISSGGSLQYTNNVSGSWRSPDTLAQFDFHNPGPVALAIDGISVAHVICVNSTGEVWYFNNRTGSWRGQIVGIGTTEGNVAIKLTTTNKVKAIYTTSATTIEYIQEQ